MNGLQIKKGGKKGDRPRTGSVPFFTAIPTPLAGLALGIASLGWCWENVGDFNSELQQASALLAGLLLLLLAAKFICFPRLLLQDLKHPVAGSVVPTFAMASMVVSKALALHFALPAQALWFVAVLLHLGFLLTFVWHRSRAFELHHMVPSWFIPPVGIIVAALTTPGGIWLELSRVLLWMGLISFALLLPAMLYRLIVSQEVPDAAKPTLAILAAPASLCLAGYLTVTASPSPLLVALLFGIAILLTLLVYLTFTLLLRLPFSPGYAAFTFPLVIGATAQYKTAELLAQAPLTQPYADQVLWLANLELGVATVIVSYVALRYLAFYLRTATAKNLPVAELS